MTYEAIQSHSSDEEHLQATGYPELIDVMVASTTLTADEIGLSSAAHATSFDGATAPDSQSIARR